MLLTEIFDTKQRERSVDSGRTPWIDPPTFKYRANNGAFNYITPHRTDPQQIRKVNRRYKQFDAHNEYIMAIARSRLAQRNPFAPRVSKISNLVDKGQGKSRMIADMEKLNPLSFLKEKQEIAIWESMTGQEYNPEIHGGISKIEIAELMYEYLTGIETTPNEQLAEIVKFIQSLQRQLTQKFSRPVYFDCKPENFMWRQTQIGPQLVITDPLA